jgi:hypothetical protein
MKPIAREEILDYVTYNEKRDEIRIESMKHKNTRRVHLGEHLTFLFENRETVRYQIQEMMRVEQIVKESDIQHEIDTYNELVGGPGELGCSLLIEIDDPSEREKLLSAWLDLPKHIYLKLDNDAKIYAKFDPRQVGDTRLSSVQYLKFDTEGKLPVAVGVDHPELTDEVRLDESQRQALAQDLSD